MIVAMNLITTGYIVDSYYYSEYILDWYLDLYKHIADAIRLVRDPEKDATLEDLNVVSEEGIKVNFNLLIVFNVFM